MSKIPSQQAPQDTQVSEIESATDKSMSHEKSQPEASPQRNNVSDEDLQSNLTAKKAVKGVDQIAVEQLLAQTKSIQSELEKLNDHKLIHTYNSIPRFLWFSLLKGISLGLGSVLGATVVLSALVYVLSQMEFIPIIGEWISAILEVVKQNPEN